MQNNANEDPAECDNHDGQKSIFVFVAKDKSEFDRYPQFDEAFIPERVGMCDFYYRLSDTCNVFFIGKLAEKTDLHDHFSDKDLLEAYYNAITKCINKALSPNSLKQHRKGVVVFTHWGGGDDQSITAGEIALQRNYDMNFTSSLPGWTFYSLSKECRNDLFNLQGDIVIGGEEELRAMLARFETRFLNHTASLIAFDLYLQSIIDSQKTEETIPYIDDIEIILTPAGLSQHSRAIGWEAYLRDKTPISITFDDAQSLRQYIKDIL